MSDNKTLARNWIVNVFSEGKLELIESLMDPAYINHDANVPGGVWQGQEGAKALVNTYRNSFPDVTFSLEDQLEDGNKVANRWTARGTHTAPFNQIPATGKQVLVSGINILKIQDGKIVEEWTNYDMFGLLVQLGVIPT